METIIKIKITKSGIPYLNRVFYQHMGVPYSHALPLKNFTILFPLFDGTAADLVRTARKQGVPLIVCQESGDYFISPGGAVTLAKALIADKEVLEKLLQDNSILNPV